MCALYFSRVWVRENKASHSAQNLEHLVRNVTCGCWIEWMLNKRAQSEWSSSAKQLSRLLCIHTVLVCSRWHTGCSLFSMGKQWSTPPALRVLLAACRHSVATKNVSSLLLSIDDKQVLEIPPKWRHVHLFINNVPLVLFQWRWISEDLSSVTFWGLVGKRLTAKFRIS